MAFFDLPLEKLQTYRSSEVEPSDFDAFWKRTLAEARQFELNARFERVEHDAYKLVDAYDVTFAGFGGQPIKGWFIEPAGNTKPLPCIVSFIGYTGGRGMPINHLDPVVAGFAHLVMDTRGQGFSTGSPGSTPDAATSGPASLGFMTRGIESPENYYYRRVFTDAVRMVEVAASHPHVDPKRIAVQGTSQGGGITLAAAALTGKQVKLAMPDVPFLCNYRRATCIVDTNPYFEITQFLRCHRDREEQVFNTLGYFDGVNFAKRIKARCLFSVGLMDNTCPPSTVFSAYNELPGRKEIRVYRYNTHEGGQLFQTLERVKFAAKWL